MKVSDLKNYTVVGGANPVSVPKQSTPFVNKIANFVGAKGITEQFGADIARLNAPQDQKNLVDYPSMKTVVGSAIQSGANLIPGAGKGAGLLAKTAIGAGTGYAFDVGSTLQNGSDNPLTPGVGTVVGGGIPLATAAIKPATRIVGRLLKGLGSGLSGVPVQTIDSIVNNPQTAQKASEQLAKSGNAKILEENARTIVNGVSKIRQEARTSYGNAIQSLKAEDIAPKTFRDSVSQSLDKIGSITKNGKRTLTNAEFDNPIMLKKANTLINKLSTTNLDEYSLNKLQNEIEGSAFKTVGADAQRLSYNAFVRDLSSSVKTAINNSTNKLNDINKAFSQDMQLAETAQNIFGKVNFKNLPEVVKASQKLETVFSQKGLAPDVVDKFLERIGVSAKDFKTTEAVRQISNKVSGANTKGLSIGEITQAATSAVVTPEMVKKMAIISGLSIDKLTPVLNSLSVPARNILINGLLQLK